MSSQYLTTADPCKLKGAALAAADAVSYDPAGYRVQSQTGKGSYLVTLEGGEWVCNCPDAAKGYICKHQRAVTIFRKAEARAARAVCEGSLQALQSRLINDLCQPLPVFVSDCYTALWHATQRAGEPSCYAPRDHAPATVTFRSTFPVSTLVHGVTR